MRTISCLSAVSALLIGLATFHATRAVGGEVVLFDNLNAQWPSGIDQVIYASSLPKLVLGRPWTRQDGYDYSWPARKFTTDASAYYLDRITIHFATPSDNTAIPELDIYSDASGSPGFLLSTLVAPDVSAGYPELGQFTASGLLLSPNSAYWAVFKASDGGAIGWAVSPDPTGTGAGYTLDGAHSLDGGATWTVDNSDHALMNVIATQVPEPGGLALCCAVAATAIGFFLARNVVHENDNK
jgi:hypothetical protein